MESEITKLMKLGNVKQIHWLIKRMQKQGRIQRVIKENGLNVYYDRRSGKVFADWKMHSSRFPYLSRRMNLMPKNREEKQYISRVRTKAKKYSDITINGINPRQFVNEESLNDLAGSAII